MNRTPPIPLVVTVVGTAAICMAAFWLSYEALTDLAERSGITTPWLWPLIVDGLIIVATVAVVARVGSYAWLLLLAGAAISVAGNVLHASLPAGALPVWLCSTVAAVPPVALVAVTHLAVILRQTHANAVAQPLAASTASSGEVPQRPLSPQVTHRDTTEFDTATGLVRRDGSSIARSSADDTDSPHLHLLAAAPATDATAYDDSRAMQSKAVALLDQGVPVCDIAEQLGVHRATVYRWRKAAS
ncbi:helix-turn-helix domain-containing protein [Rhodococcus sp. NPDC060084]|uniref:helix-turn-helix domain-containing protein n=1 Tax=Rhodococcus sp. NPDC060084 TaxID=3347053 RepID=UPI00365A8F22